MLLNFLSATEGNGMLIMLIIVGVLMVAMFVFNFISSKKQRKAEEERMNNLAVGTKIMMTCGIRGVIIAMKEISPVDHVIVIRTGTEDQPCTLTIDRRTIYQILPENAPITDTEMANYVPEVDPTAEKSSTLVEEQPFDTDAQSTEEQSVVEEENKTENE